MNVSHDHVAERRFADATSPAGIAAAIVDRIGGLVGWFARSLPFAAARRRSDARLLLTFADPQAVASAISGYVATSEPERLAHLLTRSLAYLSADARRTLALHLDLAEAAGGAPADSPAAEIPALSAAIAEACRRPGFRRRVGAFLSENPRVIPRLDAAMLNEIARRIGNDPASLRLHLGGWSA